MSVDLPGSVEELDSRLTGARYLAGAGLATTLFLALRLGRPLLLEGEAGVGKTQVAKTLAEILERRLVRLQCHEGLDAASTLYEWDYGRQLLEIRLLEAAGAVDTGSARRHLYSERFLLPRPLLQAIQPGDGPPPVLLIDELDRADEEFEAFLLEILAEYQVTIPELGTLRAAAPPVVIITSNRTREVHDALRRRCLYHWIDPPSFERELAIAAARLPEAPERLRHQAVTAVQKLRAEDLDKKPGVSETLDWIRALQALDRRELDPATVEATLGVLLKYQDDLDLIRDGGVARLLD